MTSGACDRDREHGAGLGSDTAPDLIGASLIGSTLIGSTLIGSTLIGSTLCEPLTFSFSSMIRRTCPQLLILEMEELGTTLHRQAAVCFHRPMPGRGFLTQQVYQSYKHCADPAGIVLPVEKSDSQSAIVRHSTIGQSCPNTVSDLASRQQRVHCCGTAVIIRDDRETARESNEWTLGTD